MTEQPRRVGTLPDDAPDLAPFTDAEKRPPSMIDDLTAALDKALSGDVVKEPVTFPVQLRPGVSIRYSTDIDDEKLQGWQKRTSKVVRGREVVDNIRYCSLILATQCEAFLINGAEAHDEAGNPYTFGHLWIREKYGADRAADAVRKVFGSDPHVMITANELLDRAGFGDQVVEVEGEADGL